MNQAQAIIGFFTYFPRIQTSRGQHSGYDALFLGSCAQYCAALSGTIQL